MFSFALIVPNASNKVMEMSHKFFSRLKTFPSRSFAQRFIVALVRASLSAASSAAALQC